jgi:DNA-binding NarL/FixJ family response regulator
MAYDQPMSEVVGTGTGLRGRGAECALLDETIRAVRGGESRTLVLHGEAGIGKTALLEYVVSSAGDLQLLRATGVESEMELAFASLHQLCSPLMDSMGRLPPPQRHALEVAFGLSEGNAPDRFLVGLAVLTLLSHAAERRPLLCVVDDAQWLDGASSSTFAFVARRLLAEPVGILFGTRGTVADLRGLPDLEVRGLGDEDARALLRSAVPFHLDDRTRDRFVAETGGNPLALLELPHGLTVTQVAGSFGLFDEQSLSARLEQTFRRRLEAISADARLLMLVAAADPVGDPLLVWSAAQRLGVGSEVTDGDTDGMLVIADSVRFRHPLVRSAVYAGAPAEQRRSVHLALAEATDRGSDPDRRAWHLAAASPRPAEEVAAELERSAGRAQARGGVAAAAALLQRSVALTEDPAMRAERAIAAAHASYRAGGLETARELLVAAEAYALDDFQLARIELLRGRLSLVSGRLREAPLQLLEAAKSVEKFDLELARETYMTAWSASMLASHLTPEGVLKEICAAIRGLPPREGSPSALDLALEGLAILAMEGHAAAAPVLKRAAELLPEVPAEDLLRWGMEASAVFTILWDHEGHRTLTLRNIRALRDAGVLADLAIPLDGNGQNAAWEGDFAGAAASAAECETLATATGKRMAPTAALRLRSLQGREAEASAMIASIKELASTLGEGAATTHANWAAAVLHNGLGHYHQAAAAAQEAASDTCEPFASTYALPELVEASVRIGDLVAAHDALERLVQTTQPASSDEARGIEARARALVSEGDAAERLYAEAVDRLGRTRLGPELARAQLVYGEWLRREGRRVDAREQLRRAHDAFTSIGMEAFAERARRELIATGETVRKRADETRDQLTPQEEQVARLARDGLSNNEIGAQLFLSPRTVEWHLRKVFTKLGITSRRQLRTALHDESRAVASV